MKRPKTSTLAGIIKIIILNYLMCNDGYEEFLPEDEKKIDDFAQDCQTHLGMAEYEELDHGNLHIIFNIRERSLNITHSQRTMEIPREIIAQAWSQRLTMRGSTHSFALEPDMLSG